MNLKCAIVDDEPLALDLLESYVRKTPFLELAGKYPSAVQAMKELPDRHVDLLFLDIQMPELNGLEFSKMVPPSTRIVFTTAFDQYAIDGYKVNALDYLLKPISYTDFLQAAHKAQKWFELLPQPREEIQSIFVKSDYKLVQIELKNILYIEGLKDYIKIYEHEGHGRPAARLTLHARAPLVHRAERKDTHHRPWAHRVWQDLHPHQRQLQASLPRLPQPQELSHRNQIMVIKGKWTRSWGAICR